MENRSEALGQLWESLGTFSELTITFIIKLASVVGTMRHNSVKLWEKSGICLGALGIFGKLLNPFGKFCEVLGKSWDYVGKLLELTMTLIIKLAPVVGTMRHNSGNL